MPHSFSWDPLSWTGCNFPLGASHCVSSNHFTGAALKSFKDSCQSQLFQGFLNFSNPSADWGCPPSPGKGFSRCPSKSQSFSTLQFPFKLNVPEKPPQESPAEQEKWRELSTQNPLCGCARARLCPCHPATLASTGASCSPAGSWHCFPPGFPWGQEPVPQSPAQGTPQE